MGESQDCPFLSSNFELEHPAVKRGSIFLPRWRSGFEVVKGGDMSQLFLHFMCHQLKQGVTSESGTGVWQPGAGAEHHRFGTWLHDQKVASHFCLCFAF